MANLQMANPKIESCVLTNLKSDWCIFQMRRYRLSTSYQKCVGAMCMELRKAFYSIL